VPWPTYATPGTGIRFQKLRERLASQPRCPGAALSRWFESDCRTIRLCQRIDLKAENSVITPTVKKTAPPIRIAAALADLFELPSYSINSPRTKSAADKMISKDVDILFMAPPAYVPIAARRGSSSASALESSLKAGFE
jgi:hypothetical protein